jgi:predicted RNase H-like nuclease (RuvC/YqgF family)
VLLAPDERRRREERGVTVIALAEEPTPKKTRRGSRGGRSGAAKKAAATRARNRLADLQAENQELNRMHAEKGARIRELESQVSRLKEEVARLSR